MNLSTAKLRDTARNNALPFRRSQTAIVIAAAMIGLAACGASDKPVAEQKTDAKAGEHAEKGGLKLSPEEIQRAGIKLETLKPDAMNDAITVTATIRPNQDRIARVAPRVDGRVTGVSANLGDQVRTGQTLAILDSLSLGEASSALIQAQSAYRIADADFKRAEALNVDEIIPQKEFLRAKSELEKAAAGLRAAEDKLRLLGVSPKNEGKVESNFPVTAPFAGTVIQKKATLGELASPNEPLFTVADLSRVWIEANLGEAMLAKVRLGAKATVTVSAYPGERFTGRVTYIASVLDKDSRTTPARIEVENKDGRLKLEMFASATIDTAGVSSDPKREAITVPHAAIVLMQGQPTVFVFEHGGYEQRAIEPGEKLSGRTVVKSGLAAGDQLVAAGSYALKARLLKSQISDEH
ncbi:MAG: efflux RND transporter periplasmic adaptor subunit [Telluria sp.]